jgi:hypothetical protein
MSYKPVYLFKVLGKEEWLLTERHEGWAILEHRASDTWTEVFKRRGRWDLEEEGRRTIEMFVCRASVDAVEAYLNEHEPPMLPAIERPEPQQETL